jgi:hypothetical protein
MTRADVVKRIRVFGLEHESSARVAADRRDHARAQWHLIHAIAANRGCLLNGRSGDPLVDRDLMTEAYSFGLVITAESLEG